MNKRMFAVLAVLLLLVGTEAFAEYNREVVVKVMRDNVAQMGRLREAVGKNDFGAAADPLWALAAGMKSIGTYTPPKGDKAAWDRTVDQFVSAAWRGIGACGDKDITRLNAAVTELNNFMRSGHGMFR